MSGARGRVHLSQPCCACNSLAKFHAGIARRRSWARPRYEVGGDWCWKPQGMCQCGLWNKSARGLLASIRLDKLRSRGIPETGRGAWIQAQVQDRGAMLVPKGSMNVCMLVNLENTVCAGRSDLTARQRAGGDTAGCACVYVSTVRVCCQSPVCVSAPGCAPSFASG